MTAATNPVPVFITADATHWTASQRERLFELISSIGAEPADLVPDVDDVESTGWTLELYTEAMKQLLSKYFVQAQAINEAIKNGTGFVDRATVYALGHYDESRSLKGFTRPINRAMEKLVESGALPDDAADLLAPVYDSTVTGYQRAKGFQVPLEIVRILQQHRAQVPAGE